MTVFKYMQIIFKTCCLHAADRTTNRYICQRKCEYCNTWSSLYLVFNIKTTKQPKSKVSPKSFTQSKSFKDA